MKRLTPAFSILFGLALLATPALGETSFQFSAAGTQSPEDPNVDGFRLVLFHGKNESVNGFDLGMISLSESDTSSGFSMIWGMGMVKKRSSGLASGFVNHHTGEDTGLNAAFINSVKTIKEGANIGFVNLTQGFSSVDIGGLSISNESKVQVGFINVTQKIDSIQIGFLNVAENGIFPVFPFFNMPKE